MDRPTEQDPTVWLDDSSMDLSQLEALCEQQTDPASVPLASDIVSQIPVYDGAAIREAAADEAAATPQVLALQAEWARTLGQGAGVVLVRNAVADLNMLDRVTAVFETLIDAERASGSGADHFAPRGTNTRLWNAHEKLCLQSPELFARYNANDVLALMCRAWLGPGYQITTQGNIVHPGGQAQHCHRDYHMGFQQAEQLRQYPAHVHAMSPLLTLQGAIAHSDMPLESGPTKVLPFSQQYLPGYLAAEREECIALFEQRHVQLALHKGDMLFFNPAVFHAAGENRTTDVDRFANLVQAGSMYGRTMELQDKARMSVALYPVLHQLISSHGWLPRQTRQVIEACGEAYPFPANMELEPPVNGLAPLSQQQLMAQCLEEGCTSDVFARRIGSQLQLKRSH
ncbi:phytanoyl-CoA dioxygenase family protein [Granulosicoccus sp. 3-233]|uniref:phytanoyl-CoA dioxygenase family protein n=1 Tax=Granulosicoccus sp. 3-233 TaxID=3417969 RepID=UPI003D3475EE